MFAWHNDDELFALMKERLYTPVVGDILDAMRYAHQFLPAGIHPLRDDMKIAGRACTVLECDVFEPQKKPFGLLTEALDQLEKNDVYIATGAHNSALWGELWTACSSSPAKPPGNVWKKRWKRPPGKNSCAAPSRRACPPLRRSGSSASCDRAAP